MVQITFANRDDFEVWSRSLEVPAALALGESLRFVEEIEHIDDLPSKFYKRLHSDICEMRIGKTLNEAFRTIAKPIGRVENQHSVRFLLRIFVSEITDYRLLVSSGYDKNAQPGRERQQIEIARAIEIVRKWRLQNDVF